MFLLDFTSTINLNLLPKNEEWEKDIYTFLENWYSAANFIDTQTSGSTGIPKKIRLQKEAMKKSATMTCDFLSLQEGDSALLCMPSRYIAGKMMLVRAYVRKLKLFCIKPTSAPLKDSSLSYIFSAMTPMQVQNSINNLSRIKKLIIGGAQIPIPLLEKIKNLNTEIYESFGMTETISHIALKKVSQQIINPVFKVLPNTKIRRDKRECLCILPAFSTEEIITNDLVHLVSPQEFEWLGRLDNIINSGGIKIFPEGVEKQLKKLITQEFIISSEKDPILGQKLILIVEGPEIKDLEKKLENFPFSNRYEKPKKIIYIKKFNRTPTGKIQRNFLFNS